MPRIPVVLSEMRYSTLAFSTLLTASLSLLPKPVPKIKFRAAYPSGTKLGDRTADGFVNFLDLGYFYDLSDIVGGMSISGGIGLPLLGNGGSTKVAYTAAGYVLNGEVLNEEITADEGEGSAFTYFVDFGYTFGSYEALLGLRTISTESKATVDQTKGLGKILGESTFTSSGSSTSYSLGFGYVF